MNFSEWNEVQLKSPGKLWLWAGVSTSEVRTYFRASAARDRSEAVDGASPYMV